jgi:hypothetical protein
MKKLLFLFFLFLLLAGCQDAKYHKGQYVYLNGQRVRIIKVNRSPRRTEYKIRHCGFASASDTGLLSDGSQKVTYAGTNWVEEWELDPLPRKRK